MTERKVRSFDHASCLELAADHLIEKLAGRKLEQPGSCPENGHLGGAGLPEQGDLAFGPNQRARELFPDARERLDGDRT